MKWHRRDSSVPMIRLIKAATFVLAGLLVAPGIDALVHAAHASGRLPAETVGIDAGFLARAPDEQAALDELETLLQEGRNAPPEAFAEEAGMLPGARDARVSADGRVIGYLVDVGPEEAMAALTEQMANRGWTDVPLGGVCGATFVKRDGVYTWAIATCTQVGSATSVVVRM